jgi:hypothetical protein
MSTFGDILEGTAGVAVAGSSPAMAGSIFGDLFSKGDREKAQQIAQEAYAQLQAIGAPPEMYKDVLLQNYKQAGLYTPGLEDKIEQATSKVSQLQEDPRVRAAQADALSKMQQLGRTGLGAEDRAALNQVRAETQRDAQAKQQQILQAMQARGQSGSGAELAAALSSSQGSADRASEEGDRIAAQAAQKALQAISQSGTMAGQLRSQDFTAANTRASAEDEMNRFNTQQAIARQQYNVGAKNQAQQLNLAQSQRVSDLNVDQANKLKMAQEEAKRQQWLDQITGAQVKAGALLGQSGIYQNAANRTAGAYQGIGNTAQAGFNAAMQLAMSSAGAGGAGSSVKDAKNTSFSNSPGANSSNSNFDGMSSGGAMMAAHGGMVPGRPEVDEDSAENDKVHALLSPGEVVIPRSVVKHLDKVTEFFRKVTEGSKNG